MASSGKDRPNLKICIDNVEESSDVGMSDCEEEDIVVNTNVDDKSFDDEEDDTGRVEAEKTEEVGAGFRFQQTEREECVKRKTEEHARKSGTKHSIQKVDEDELQKLYESLGVAQSQASADKSERGVRLDAVHVRGVENMTTDDVFKYFDKFAPEAIEWIDDRSCNVVCEDSFNAARAIMALTNDTSDVSSTEGDDRRKPSRAADDEGSEARKKASSGSSESGDDDHLDLMADVEDCTKSSSKAEKDKDEEEEEGEVKEGSTSNDESGDKIHSAKSTHRSKLVTPPPGKWRHGRPCSKANHLFLRFATKADRKVSGAKERSDDVQEQQSSSYGGSKGLASNTRKRRLRAVEMKEDDGGMEEDEGTVGLVTRPHRVSAVSAGHIPDETLFDLHTKDAQTQRLKTARLQRQMKWSADEDLMDSEPEMDDVAPPPPKRSMRMYADDVEEELRGKRSRPASSGAMAMDASSHRQTSVHSRLQLGARQQDQRDRRYPWREDAWRRPAQRAEPSHDWDDDDDGSEAGPWVGTAATWGEERQPARASPPVAAKRNGIWNRNPDWDQNRYKDLDAPPEEGDGGWQLPSRELDFTGRGAGRGAGQGAGQGSNGEEMDNEEEEGEVQEEEDSDSNSRGRVKDRRWQWRTETSEGGSAGDLRRKLDSRRKEFSSAAW